MVTLQSIAPARALAFGESLVELADSQGTGTIWVVAEGSLDLTMAISGETIGLATVIKGECLEAAGDAPALMWGGVAREPSSVMQVPPAVLELVPPATRLAILHAAATSASIRFNTLVTRHAALVRRGQDLVVSTRATEDRTRACLGSASLQGLIAGIPRLPLYATDLAMKLMDERLHADEVMESIKRNPSLAGLVLKRANSAAYGRLVPVADYLHAFLVLGVNTIYQLILESGVESIVPDSPEARQIQNHAHLVSVLTGEVATLVGGVQVPVASTIGLLHDIGRSVVLLLRQTHRATAGLFDLLDPAALGAAVLESWGLPTRLVRVIESQHRPEFLPPERLDLEYRRDIAVLHLAHVCAEWLVSGAPRAPYLADYMALLGLSGGNYLDFFEQHLVPAARKRMGALPMAVRSVLDRTAPHP
jgi:putative nucleotidyltransferase with HDIG domain